MKKVVSLVLCLLMVFSTCFVASAAGTTATLNAPDSVNVGENVEVILNVSGCANATSVGAAVSFDTEAFELVSGEYLLQGGVISNYDPATSMGAWAAVAASNVNGDVFKLVLKAKAASASADVTINFIAKNGQTELENIVATKSIAVVLGDVSVTFDTIEENFDGETVNPLFAELGEIENGKLVFDTGKEFTVGSASSSAFVFEADVTFDGVLGNKGNGNGSNFINFVLGKHQLRYLGSFTKDAEDATLVTGELMTGLGWQNHDGSAWITETYINENKACPNPTQVGAVVRVRIEVVGSTVTAKLIYNDTVYGVIRDRGVKAGTMRVKGPSVAGSKVTLDNIKIAYLDTAKAEGASGLALSGTVVKPGSPDDNTGLFYGGNVTYSVFGSDMTTFVGGAVTIEANDNYNVNKPGLRTGVTLKVGDQVLGIYDITYTNNYGMTFTEDFSKDFFGGETQITTAKGTNWVLNGGAQIKDGVLDLYGQANAVIGDTSWDNYVLEADITLAQIPGLTYTNAGLVAYIGVLNQSSTAAKALQLRFNPAANKESNVTVGTDTKTAVAQFNKANNATGITTSPAFSTSNFTTVTGSTSTPKVGASIVRHIRVEVVNGFVTFKYKEEGDSDWTFVYTVSGFEGKTGSICLASNSAPMHVTVDNLSVTSIEDYADQSPYVLTVGEDASIVFNPANASITATGTATAKFYGFKPNGTINLADVADEMVYVGNNTVLYGDFELPCTMYQSTGEPITHEGGLVNGTGKIGNIQIPFTNYTIEYEFTPYYTDYLRNPTVQLYIPSGTSGKNYEIAAYYQGLSTTSNDIDDTLEGKEYWPYGLYPTENGQGTSWGANYMWRLFGRGTNAGSNEQPKHTAANGPALVANTEYNGVRDELTTDGKAAIANADKVNYFATADKLTEGVISYKIQVVVLNGDLSLKVKLATDETAWDDIQPIATVADANLGTNPTIYFNTAAQNGIQACEAEVANIVVTEIVEEAEIVGYEATGTQVIKAGFSKADIDTTFKAVLSNGVKFELPSVFITDVTGFDANKPGKQTVTLHYGEVEIAKEILVVDYNVVCFENFEGYTGKPSTTGTDGATIKWNTDNGVVADGKMSTTQTFQLINVSNFTEGVIATDVILSSAKNSGKHAFAVTKLSSVASDNINFGVVFDTVDGEVVSKLFISKLNTVLASCDFDLALDTEYRFEMRIYSNVVKGYVDGVEMLTYVDDGTYYDAIIGAANKRVGISTGGVGGGEIQALITPETTTAASTPVVDNVISGVDFATYTITAAEGVTALQTVAQPGDKVVISADVVANGTLWLNSTTPIFENAANDFGGSGNDFAFTMPAQDVVIDFYGADGRDIATVGTSIREDKSAVRFLNRLYLPAVKDEEGNTIALELGDITEFGALILPTKLLEGDLTAETARAYKAVAYNAEKFVRYDVTGKYVDYVVAVNSKDLEREFTCVAYYVVNGEYVYGEAVAQSINGWLAQ